MGLFWEICFKMFLWNFMRVSGMLSVDFLCNTHFFLVPQKKNGRCQHQRGTQPTNPRPATTCLSCCRSEDPLCGTPRRQIPSVFFYFVDGHLSTQGLYGFLRRFLCFFGWGVGVVKITLLGRKILLKSKGNLW